MRQLAELTGNSDDRFVTRTAPCTLRIIKSNLFLGVLRAVDDLASSCNWLGDDARHRRRGGPRRDRRVRLLLYISVPLAVVAVLAPASAVWWRWDSARRPKLDSDLLAMDEAITATVTAAGPTVPPTISGVFQGAVCDLGPLRDGGCFTRSVGLYTDPRSEAALIDGSPPGYPPPTNHAGASPPAPLRRP